MNEFDRTGKQYPTSFNQFCARLRQVTSASACIWDYKIPETAWLAQKLSKIAILRPRNGPIRRRLRHGKYYNCISFENPGRSSVARPFLCQFPIWANRSHWRAGKRGAGSFVVSGEHPVQDRLSGTAKITVLPSSDRSLLSILAGLCYIFPAEGAL